MNKNKKAVSSLIAWVLLIGFAVTLGVFVTKWSLQQAQKSTTGIEEMVMGDIQCSDVAISGYCDESNNIKIKNRGTLTIAYLVEAGNLKTKHCEDLEPNSVCPEKLKPGKYIPVIFIDNKKVLCTTQQQEFKCSE